MRPNVENGASVEWVEQHLQFKFLNSATLWKGGKMVKPVAHHISLGQASKDDRFDEASYMENALMQQPSHMHIQNFREIKL